MFKDSLVNPKSTYLVGLSFIFKLLSSNNCLDGMRADHRLEMSKNVGILKD